MYQPSIEEIIMTNAKHDIHLEIMNKTGSNQLSIPLLCYFTSTILNIPVRNFNEDDNKCTESCVFSYDSVVNWLSNAQNKNLFIIQCPVCKKPVNKSDYCYDISLDLILAELQEKNQQEFKLAQKVVVYQNGRIELDLEKDLNSAQFQHETDTKIQALNQIIFNSFKAIQAFKNQFKNTQLLANNNQNQNSCKFVKIQRNEFYENFPLIIDEQIKITKKISSPNFIFSRSDGVGGYLAGRQGKLRQVFLDFPEKQRLFPIVVKYQTEKSFTHLSLDFSQISLALDNSLNLWLTGGINIKTRKESTPSSFIIDLKNVFQNKTIAINGPNLIQARCQHTSIFLNDYIYVFGGVFIDVNNDETILANNTCERINVLNPQKFEQIAPLQLGRKLASCTRFQNRYIYIFGGLTNIQGQNTYAKTIEVLDTQTLQWKVINVSQNNYLPLQSMLVFQSSNDSIVLVGGVDYQKLQEMGGRSKVLQEYSISQNKIVNQKLDALPYPESFCDNSIGFFKQKYYFLSNRDNSPDLYSYDQNTKQIETTPSKDI